MHGGDRCGVEFKVRAGFTATAHCHKGPRGGEVGQALCLWRRSRTEACAARFQGLGPGTRLDGCVKVLVEKVLQCDREGPSLWGWLIDRAWTAVSVKGRLRRRCAEVAEGGSGEGARLRKGYGSPTNLGSVYKMGRAGAAAVVSGHPSPHCAKAASRILFCW